MVKKNFYESNFIFSVLLQIAFDSIDRNSQNDKSAESDLALELLAEQRSQPARSSVLGD